MDKSRDDHPLPLDNKLKKRPQSFGAYTRHEEEEEKKECKHEVSRQGKQRVYQKFRKGLRCGGENVNMVSGRPE